MSAAEEERPDTDAERIAAVLQRYRDVAKWIIGVVAAVAGALTAGLGLTSLGKLDGVELGLATLGIVVVIAVIAIIVLRAAALLRPESVRIDEISTDDVAYLKRLGFETLGATDGEELQTAQVRVLRSGVLSDAEAESWRSQRRDMGAQIAFRRVSSSFKRTIEEIVKLAVIGALAICLFAFASTQEEADSPKPAVPPKPVAATVHLSAKGRDNLRGSLGADCVKAPVAAIAIGGEAGNAQLIAIPSDRCNPARFTVTTELGTVEGSKPVLASQ